MPRKNNNAATPVKRNRATDELRAAVAKEFKTGTALPAVVKKLGSANLVSPIFWRLQGEAQPFALATVENSAKLRAAVLKARKDGQRREVVAARASISVAKVRELEGKSPVYTGKGTKRHLTAAA